MMLNRMLSKPAAREQASRNVLAVQSTGSACACACYNRQMHPPLHIHKHPHCKQVRARNVDAGAVLDLLHVAIWCRGCS